MTSRAVDAVYGEKFTFIAFRQAENVNAKRQPDPTRPTFTVVGAGIFSSHTKLPEGRGIAANYAQGVVVSVPWVSVDNSRMPWRAITGDRVKREKTGETYEIAKPVPDGVARTVFSLTGKQA